MADSKTCVKCRQKDVTDFSTCRFCGTRYDAAPPKAGKIQGEGIGGLLRSWPSLIVILLLLMLLKGPFMRMAMFVAAGGHTIDEVARQEAADAQKPRP